MDVFLEDHRALFQFTGQLAPTKRVVQGPKLLLLFFFFDAAVSNRSRSIFSIIPNCSHLIICARGLNGFPVRGERGTSSSA
jgi:hypothetical protein